MALEINSVIKTPRSLTIIGTGALLFVLVGYFFIKLDKKQHKSSKKQHQQVEQSDTTTAIKTIDQEESHVVVEPSLVEIVKVEPIKEEEMTKNKKVVKTTVSSSHDDDQTVPTSAPPQPPQPVKLESDKVAPVDLKDNTESVVSVPKLESSKIEEHSDKKVDNESKVKSNTVENQVPSSKSKSKKKNKSELESAPAKPVVNTTNVTKPSTNVSNAVPVSKKASKGKKLEATVSNKLLVETSDKSSNSDSLYEDIVVYEFNFPRKLCGKLIGRNGVHVDQIRAKTHTQIAVRNDPTTDDLQIVCVSGRVEEVDQALEMITQRFPAKIYPEISFKPISKPIKYRRSKNMDVLIGGTPQNVDHDAKVFVAPQSMFVDLMNVMPHTINTEESKEPVTYTEEELAEMAINIHVTSVVNTGHVFIQVPSNPMYENLEKLDVAMLNAYSILDDEKEIPLMKEPIDFGTICAAPTSYGWHRAMVVDYTPKEELNGEECGVATIKFLDYGGYLTLPTNQLRQLRSDFMLLPFQAIECYLDGIFPYEDKLEKGKTFLYNLIKNSVIKAVLTGYAEDGLPLLTLFITNELYQNNNLNNELIKYNFAYSVNHQEQDSFTESFSLSDTDQSFHKDHTGMLNEQTIH